MRRSDHRQVSHTSVLEQGIKNMISLLSVVGRGSGREIIGSKSGGREEPKKKQLLAEPDH